MDKLIWSCANTLARLAFAKRKKGRARDRMKSRSARLEALEPRQMLTTYTGTAIANSFEISWDSGSSSWKVEMDGVPQPDPVWPIEIDGGEGDDTISVYGTADDETAKLYPDWFQIVRPGPVEYDVDILSVESVTVIGNGGNDIAKLYDSAGDDTFEARSDPGELFGHAELSGSGFHNTVVEFPWVYAYANNTTGGGGGDDKAHLYDTPGDDIFKSLTTHGVLYDANPATFAKQAKYFEEVHAFADDYTDDEDVARIYDSDGDDLFIADPTEATMLVWLPSNKRVASGTHDVMMATVLKP